MREQVVRLCPDLRKFEMSHGPMREPRAPRAIEGLCARHGMQGAAQGSQNVLAGRNGAASSRSSSSHQSNIAGSTDVVDMWPDPNCPHGNLTRVHLYMEEGSSRRSSSTGTSSKGLWKVQVAPDVNVCHDDCIDYGTTLGSFP